MSNVLKKYGERSVQKMLTRFGITPEEFDTDKRFSFLIQKYLDDDVYFQELKAEIERLKSIPDAPKDSSQPELEALYMQRFTITAKDMTYPKWKKVMAAVLGADVAIRQQRAEIARLKSRVNRLLDLRKAGK